MLKNGCVINLGSVLLKASVIDDHRCDLKGLKQHFSFHLNLKSFLIFQTSHLPLTCDYSEQSHLFHVVTHKLKVTVKMRNYDIII